MLEIEELVKHYGNFCLNCSMKVETGRITGLVGENGAGKSTTFKALLGLIRPDGGKISFFGKRPENLTVQDKQKIGVTLAESGFSGYLRVKDVIPVLGAMYPLFDRDLFLRLCSDFGIPLDKSIKEFSTGMKAKLKVIAAVTHGADFLLMDEPTTGLDVMTREKILHLFRAYMEQDENRSILISSHISTDLEDLCDDVYVIHQGRIILHEEMDVLLNEYGLLKMDDRRYETVDKKYLIAVRKELFGYACLTDQKAYYAENYPDIVIEKGNLDHVITMLAGGEER